MTSSIQTSPHGADAVPTTTPGLAKAAADSTATAAGVAAPMPAQVSSEQLEMKLLLDDAAGGSPSSGAEDTKDAEPTSNTNGAPWLPDPSQSSMSAADIADFLAVMNEKMATDQVGPLQAGLKAKNAQQQQALDRSRELILKNIDLAKKADARRKASGILGWIKKSVTFVAAAVAVAVISVAVPAAAPALTLVLIGAFLNSAASLASDLSVACGGPELPNSISSALSAGLTILLEEAGADEDLAKGLGMVMSGAMALVACFATGGAGAVMMDPGFMGQLVGGSAMLGGSGEAMTNSVTGWTTVAATAITALALLAFTGPLQLSDKAFMVLKASQVMSAGTQVGTGLYQAKIDLELGALKAKQMEFKADATEIGAAISRLTSQWQAIKSELDRVIRALSDNNGIIADILNGDQEQKSHMLSNMNSKATV